MDRMVAPAALGRAVLLGRAAATLTAAGAELRLVNDPRRLIIVLAIVLATTVAGLVVLSRNPHVVRHPILIVALDLVLVLVVLAVSQGGVAYFCCAAGASALAGVLLGMRALMLCSGHAALGYVVADRVLHAATPSPGIAAFVLAFPMCAGIRRLPNSWPVRCPRGRTRPRGRPGSYSTGCGWITRTRISPPTCNGSASTGQTRQVSE